MPFAQGLNIIYGDSATGKSSILECINYLLGSSKFIYDQEIESSVLYVMMQVWLSGAAYVIKRDIFDVNGQIEVYSATLETMSNIYPQKYSPNFNREGHDGYFSDFLLSALSMPSIKVRQAPTKDESPLTRLSFRDVFKFCYLKQDDVGSKNLLGEGSYQGVKNKETFKYLFNLLDTNISDLQVELSAALSEQKKAEATYRAVSEFLRTVEFKTEFDLDDAVRDVDERNGVASLEFKRINAAIISNSESYSALKDILNSMTLKIADAEGTVQECDQSIERFVRLKNDYHGDIKKLKSMKVAKQVIGSPQLMFSCPLCDSSVRLEDVQHEHEIDRSDQMSQEINSLLRRIRDLERLVERERGKRGRALDDLKVLASDRDNARRMLDEEMTSAITPYLAERDAWSYEIAKIQEERKGIERSIKVRNQQKQIFRDLQKAADRILALEEKLAAVRRDAPSISELLTEMGDALFKFLRFVQISELRDVRIDERSLLPVLRNRDYRDTTSGGLRTILSIGHFLGILSASMRRHTNFPGLLMIDTVGKYLGKTNEMYKETDLAEDKKEGVSDPRKYANIFRAMLELGRHAEEFNSPIQIIVVDNDVPPEVRQSYPSSIAAYFNNEGADGASRGLIDDAHLH